MGQVVLIYIRQIINLISRSDMHDAMLWHHGRCVSTELRHLFWCLGLWTLVVMLASPALLVCCGCGLGGCWWVDVGLGGVSPPFNRNPWLRTTQVLSGAYHVHMLMSMDANRNMYQILILPVSNTFHFCHHPQSHHSQPYHTQSIIYHPSSIINGNSRYWGYSITILIFPIFNRLPSLIHPPLNSVKWSSPQNDSCHRRYSPIWNLSSTMHIFRNEANSPSWW